MEPTEPEPDDALDVPETSTEVVPVSASYLPVPAEWQIIMAQAEVLASSDLVPAAYRRKPANVVLATLSGRPYGWDASMSMRSFHVIEGVPSMKPEVMSALVRKAGHSISGHTTIEEATITGKRGDNGDEMTVSFSLDDAVQAGLCTLKDGKPFARSGKGQKLPWEQYPEDMMWARSLSKLCRRLFPDVVLGAGYTPEELSGGFGNALNVELSTIGSDPAIQTVDEDIAEGLRARANALPGESRSRFKTLLNEKEIGGFPSNLLVVKVPAVTALLDALEKEQGALVVDVEPPAATDVAPTRETAREAIAGNLRDAIADITDDGKPAEKPKRPPRTPATKPDPIEVAEVPANVDTDGVVKEWTTQELMGLTLTQLQDVPQPALLAACLEQELSATSDMTAGQLADMFDNACTDPF